MRNEDDLPVIGHAITFRRNRRTGVTERTFWPLVLPLESPETIEKRLDGNFRLATELLIRSMRQ